MSRRLVPEKAVRFRWGNAGSSPAPGRHTFYDEQRTGEIILDVLFATSDVSPRQAPKPSLPGSPPAAIASLPLPAPPGWRRTIQGSRSRTYPLIERDRH